ncbi:hypothetical protein CXX93_19495 (plasmid) [Gordonia sp. YC-JH1]|nr:hypothetical protein CXX93_19110 [Gordonia sp. YC-JH1]AUH70597.1 hypothetical protein CXX93_19495 [Gordonia sp. YC-JH1]
MAVWLLKALGLGIVFYLFIGLTAGLMVQHELSGTQMLVVVITLSWLVTIAFVARFIINRRRLAVWRRAQAQQHQQWVMAMQQAEWHGRRQAAYDAEYRRQIQR